jgi:[protein-PII] uridylyltransferase
MTAPERALRTERADQLCRSAFATALGERPERGLALVAVGGYGRSELAPHSDLDVVLVHEPDVADADVTEVAKRLWYPLWDSGVEVDHSVRALDGVRGAAIGDVRVALGLLDVRHLAGDTAVTLQLRADVLAAWRRGARVTLPRLRDWARDRTAQRGEPAPASVPDLKESAGGIRDAVLMRALVATWLVDVPHQELERCHRRLLDVRDLVHDLEGRGVDRIRPELWAPLADRLGVADAEAAQQHVRALGRRTTHLSRLAWRRADGVLAAPAATARRSARPGPVLEPAGRGVAVAAGEVVLDRDARPTEDPLLLLRAAAVAAERDLPLGPASVSRLLRESPEIPLPWPPEGRELLVRLLAGRGLVQVWESLEELQAVERLLPEWRRLRLLPHASVIHRFTVDRHVLETCAEAGRMIRRVDRPDLLLVAALLHDIGKGESGDHSVTGEPVAREACERWGFPPPDVDVVGRLVRHHLLLTRLATTRDLDDPTTRRELVERLHDRTTLDLLEVLSEADARATSPQAWTSWRAQLVADLARRARLTLVGVTDALPTDVVDGARQRLEILHGAEGLIVHVREPDRLGLLADVAATFLASRLPVLSARADTRYGVAWSTWVLGRDDVDPAHLARRLLTTLDGDPPSVPARLAPGPDDLPAQAVIADGAGEATVLEVRAHDRPGTLHAVLRALAGLGLSTRSAHLGSIGPQVVDVFYLEQPDGSPLTPALQQETVAAVRRALSPAATLDA